MEKKFTDNPVIKVLLERRSIRSFTDQSISKSDLSAIIETALYAPSGKNRQDWHFTIVTKQEHLSELNKAIIKAQKRDSDYCCYYGAPVLIIVSSLATNELSPYDCACALQNIFLSAHALNIGSCWINQPGASTNNPEVRQVLTKLGVPENHNVYGCAALGYATQAATVHPRKPNSVHWA